MEAQGYLPTVELEPDRPARASVIWLHGLGADGHDFEPIVPYLGLSPESAVRFVFPNAPERAVTINMGFVMPAWYDILSPDLRRDADEAGIRESAERIVALLARETERGIPAQRIVLAGFSQGGAIALHVALRYPQPLAGALALSTYLVCEETLAAERNSANQDLPIFQAHGTEDPMVPIARGEAARAKLEELGYAVQWKTYPMQHEVSPAEIAEIGAWLAERLAV